MGGTIPWDGVAEVLLKAIIRGEIKENVIDRGVGRIKRGHRG